MAGDVQDRRARALFNDNASITVNLVRDDGSYNSADPRRGGHIVFELIVTLRVVAGAPHARADGRSANVAAQSARAP